MSADPKAARAIFMTALDKAEPSERAAYLAQACGTDDALRQRVEVLLKANDDPGSFLRSPANMVATIDEPPVAEKPGTVIGPYELIQEIGEGGMGTVFMARQTEPVKRVVALKIIKAGMDSRQVIARFEAERQALALMDHPNIAKVLEAGTTNSGRPYFVMELVKGVSITKYCDEHRLTPRQRLELFIPVCQAVQHAHQKGIIHRDLKPSNILVAQYDGRPVPKVIDFGVAKATGLQLTKRTLVTGFGAVVGTLEYMSPEQAEVNQLDIDTRSDIYALGVLLYELLAGSPPFSRKELEKAGMLEKLRLIREQEPSKPSTKLSTADGLPTLAANRGTEPAKLTKLVRGELDWIVMKALEKDRDRRYETANGFAMDVQRYLADEPVEAGPPSAGYRLRKLARRYRGPLRVATAFLVFLIAGALLSAWLAVRATLAEAASGQERDRAVDAEHVTQQALADTTKAREETAKALKESQEYAKRLNEEKLASERMRYVGDMRLAQHAWDQTDIGRLRDLLAFHQPQSGADGDLRGFEWWYWHRLSKMELFTLKGHTSTVFSVAFSPDGRRLAIWSHDKTVKVWNAATGQDLLTLKGHTSVVNSVAFSPDGRRLASASSDKTIKLWDVATGQELLTLKGHTHYVRSVSFSPDGRRLASASDDKTVRLWDAAMGQELLTLKGHTSWLSSVAFSPDGQRLVSASADKTVKLWNAAIDQELLTLKEHTSILPTVAFSPDGKRLASASFDKTVKLWDAAIGQQVLTLKGHTNYVQGVAFCPVGRRIASASFDKTVKLWDAATGQELLTLKGHTSAVYGVVFSPDGLYLSMVIYQSAGERT